jgi:hypothetical protein
MGRGASLAVQGFPVESGDPSLSRRKLVAIVKYVTPYFLIGLLKLKKNGG